MSVDFTLTLIPIAEYQGLSTDTRPQTDVTPGALYFETDTGRRLQWDGLAWNAISREELGLQLQLRQLTLLSRILESLEGVSNEPA